MRAHLALIQSTQSKGTDVTCSVVTGWDGIVSDGIRANEANGVVRVRCRLLAIRLRGSVRSHPQRVLYMSVRLLRYPLPASPYASPYASGSSSSAAPSWCRCCITIIIIIISPSSSTSSAPARCTVAAAASPVPPSTGSGGRVFCQSLFSCSRGHR